MNSILLLKRFLKTHRSGHITKLFFYFIKIYQNKTFRSCKTDQNKGEAIKTVLNKFETKMY